MLYYEAVITETQACETNISRQLKPEYNVNTFIGESTNLLRKLDYKILRQGRIDGKSKLELVREIAPDKEYPRFHLEVTVPNQVPQLEIVSFHFDNKKHKARVEFSKKSKEVENLIRQLKEMDKSIVRDVLIVTFQSELLFGNVREINGIVEKEDRWLGLLSSKKRDRLGKGEKYRWNLRKQNQMYEY
jgi:hypothetical protein